MMGTGKVALITGASRGIGQAMALAFAQAGAHVAINYSHTTPDAQETLHMIQRQGGTAYMIQANVANEQEVQHMVADVIARWGRLDVLVNNAGITRDNLLIRMALEEWEDVMATNLRGPFLCTKYALRPMMRQKSGRIINIASISGILGNSGQANYAASKAGLIGLTKAIAQEYAAKGITANAIAPGLVDTPMSHEVRSDVARQKLAMVLLGRTASPAEIAQSAVYLASDGAQYINGAVLRIDGGIRF